MGSECIWFAIAYTWQQWAYKYGVDIDDFIRQAMQVKELIEKNTYNYCITHKDYIFTD